MISQKVVTCANGHFLGLNEDENSLQGEKFCPACGAEILTKCPNCGNPILRNKEVIFSKHCSYCGQLFPWWTKSKIGMSPMSEDELKILESNLKTQELLKKLVSF